MRTLQQVTLLEIFLSKISRIYFYLHCKYTEKNRQNQILKEEIWDKVDFFLLYFLSSFGIKKDIIPVY